MTSTFMTSSVNYTGCTGSNFQNFSTYGLSYYNDSGAEYSDEYQSSISPVASPELSSCRIKNNFQQYPTNDFYCYQNYSSQHIKNEETLKRNYQHFDKLNLHEMQNMKSPLKPQLSIPMKKMIQNHPNKPIIVAPEVMKKRRVAANARERRRMNNLNFAFDK